MIRLKVVALAVIALVPMIFARAQKSTSPNLTPMESLKPSTSYSEEELEKMVPRARPEDVASPEAVIRAMHDSVSGPRGEWNPDRFRSLMLPNAFFAYDDVGKDGTLHISTITVDGLIAELQRHRRETSWYEEIIDVPTLIRIHRNKHVILATLSATGVEGPQPHPEDKEAKTSTTTLIYIGKRWWIVSHTF